MTGGGSGELRIASSSFLSSSSIRGCVSCFKNFRSASLPWAKTILATSRRITWPIESRILSPQRFFQLRDHLRLAQHIVASLIGVQNYGPHVMEDVRNEAFDARDATDK